MNNSGKMTLNTHPPYPVPFPLSLHDLPLWSLDRACLQAEPLSSFETRVGSATYNHTINGSSAPLTNWLTLGIRTGPAPEVGLSVDAWKGHASSRRVNSELVSISAIATMLINNKCHWNVAKAQHKALKAVRRSLCSAIMQSEKNMLPYECFIWCLVNFRICRFNDGFLQHKKNRYYSVKLCISWIVMACSTSYSRNMSVWLYHCSQVHLGI